MNRLEFNGLLSVAGGIAFGAYRYRIPYLNNI